MLWNMSWFRLFLHSVYFTELANEIVHVLIIESQRQGYLLAVVLN